MATFPKLLKGPHPWLIKKGLFMSPESPEGSGTGRDKGLETYETQVIEKLEDKDQKEALKEISKEMEKNGKKPQDILVALQTAVNILQKLQKEPEKYRAPVLAVWKELANDKELTHADLAELITVQSKTDQEKLKDEIANGMTDNRSIYLEGKQGPVTKELKGSSFNVGDEYTIDFGIGDPSRDQDKAKAAQKIMRLDQMVPEAVRAVLLNSKKYGKIALYRSPDGKFRKEGQTIADRHVPVYQGDMITILANQGESDLTAIEEGTKIKSKDEWSKEIKAEKENEAAARSLAVAEAAKERNQEALKRALGEADQAEGLVRGRKVEIPAEFGRLNRAVLEADLIHFNNGEQVLHSVKTFSRLNGEKNPMQIMQELIDCKVVRFQEITRAVYNKTPNKLREEYDRASNDVKVIDFAEQEIARIMSEHPEYKGSSSNEAARAIIGEVKAEMIKNDFSDEDVTRFYLYTGALLPQEMVPDAEKGLHNLDDLRKQVANLRDFYVASQSFMEGVGQMSSTESNEVKYSSHEKDDAIQNIEAVAKDIFDPESGYPETHQTWMKALFGPKQSDTLNMMNLDQNVLRKDRPAYEAAISGKAAYDWLRNDSSSFNSKGEEIGNLEAFAKTLERLRRQGWEFVQANPELRAKYEKSYEKLTTITQDNYDNLSDKDRALIRYGALVEQSNVYVKAKQEMKASEEASEQVQRAQKAEVIASYPPEVQGMLKALDEKGNFTAEELNQLGNKIKEVDLGMLGLLYKQKSTLKEGEVVEVVDVEKTIAASYTKPITLLETEDGTQVTLSLGVHDNIIKHEFGFHAGLGAEKKVNDRVKLGAGIGLGSSAKEVGAGAKVSVGIDLGKYKTVSVGASAGIDLDALGFALGINVTRDLNAVVEAKADQIAEEQKQYINAALTHYLEGPYFEQLSAEQKNEYKASLAQLYLREIHNQGLDDLRSIQFLGAGLMVVQIPGTPMTLPVPWIKIGIKGKELIHYSRPDDMPEMTELADVRIKEKLTQETGAEIHKAYVSGRFELNKEGEKTISDSQTPLLETSSIDRLNAGLVKQGITLEEVDGQLRLKVKRVNGMVNLFTDPASGIEAYVKDGYTYINLDASDHLTLRRVDTYYPMPYFGHTHYVNLYLSNNLSVTGSTIEQSSKDKISWQQSDLERKQMSATRIERTTETKGVGSSNFADQEAMKKADINEGDFLSQASVEEQQKALEAIRQAMGSEAETSLNAPEIRRTAEAMLKEMKIDYVKLTTDENYTKEKISEAGRVLGRPLNNIESTYLIQELLVRSRAKAPEDPLAFAKHVLGWNETALIHSLQQKNLPAEMAQSISNKIMARYGSTILSLEAGGVQSQEVKTASILHTLIGPKADGRLGEFITGEQGDVVKLVGMVNLNQEQLIKTFKLTEEEAQAFLAAELASLAPRDSSKPYEFMHTELGLAVFEAAPLLFGPETARILIEISKMKSTGEMITPEQRKAWTEYANLVNDLRSQQQVKYNGMILTLNREAKMGFLEACRNFTTTLHEGLAILLPTGVEAMSTNVIEYLESIHGVEFYGAGVAGSVSIREKELPPEEVPPEENPGNPREGGIVSHENEASEGDQVENTSSSSNSPRG